MAKIKGIGGIFFKSENPETLKEWYKKFLGLNTDEYGAGFRWHLIGSDKKEFTQWSPFPRDTDYFTPSIKDFMINYIVDDLEQMVTELKESGLTPLDEVAVYEYGKFIHLVDPEGNKIELWEPDYNFQL